jgi:hypothetical protein
MDTEAWAASELRDDYTPRFGEGDGNGLVAIHIVSTPDLDAAVPEPADPYLDFAVVNLLKLDGEIAVLLRLVRVWMCVELANC